MKGLDLKGQKFGRLTAMATNPIRTKQGLIQWKCLCDCGNGIITTGSHLVSGHTRSCGCLQQEVTTVRSTKHGQAKRGLVTPLFMVWQNMIRRCYEPNKKDYKNYGGRGIGVCSRWLESFENFYVDMGDCPEGMTLDRKNNDGNYCKENCRWATKIEQMNNKRSNVWKEYKGERKTVAQWARSLDIHEGTLRTRFRSGWSVNRAFNTPGDM